MLPLREVPAVTAVFLAGMGVVIVFGGPERLTGRGYMVALTLFPYWVWGGWMVASGAVLGVGAAVRSMRWRVAGYFMGTVWCLFFACSVAASALRDPLAGLTGIVAYTFIAYTLTVFARMARAR